MDSATLRTGLLSALLVAALVGPAVAPAVAQDRPMRVAPGFDVGRAYMPDVPDFPPFLVEETMSLRDALRQGRVDEETAILVTEQGGTRLALILDQMAHHHVAQGVLAGEPWMVSF